MCRKELDRTRQTVLNKMAELRDHELVGLVSLGGWLGGTQALASVLKQNYSVEGSDLLNQPELVKQLKDDFNTLPPGRDEARSSVRFRRRSITSSPS